MAQSEEASTDVPTIPNPAPARARPKTDPTSKPKRQPPYSVIIENDDEHSIPYVIDGLRKVFGYGWFKSMRLTMRAHFQGRAAVWTGSFEVAEFKRDRIRSLGPDLHAPRPVYYPLGCTIEPLPE